MTTTSDMFGRTDDLDLTNTTINGENIAFFKHDPV